MTAWIVVGCVLSLLVLLFTVRVGVTIALRDELSLSVRAFGIRIRVLPRKPKRYRLRRYTLRRIRRRDAKAARKRAKKAAKKAKRKAEEAALTEEERRARKRVKKASKPPLPDLIDLIARVAGLFCSRFFGKLRIRVARIRVTVGSDDAAKTALLYAAVSQAVRGLLAALQRISHVDGLERADIAVLPDYTGGSVSADLLLTFRVSLGNLLGALCKAGARFLTGYARIKPRPARGSRKPARP